MALIATGAIAGFASTLLGIGGGLILVPAMTILFGIPLKRAVGTSLACIIPVACVGVAVEFIHRPANIRWLGAALLVSGSLLGSYVGTDVVRRLPETLFRRIFGVFLALAAVQLIFASTRGDGMTGLTTLEPLSLGAALLTVAGGALAGVTSALFGVGGGIIAVPVLSLGLSDVGFHAARATSLVMIIPTSAVGALLHGKLGHVDRSAAQLVVPAGFVAAAIGVLVANRSSATVLQVVFAVLLLTAAVRTLRAPRGAPATPPAGDAPK